MKYGRDDMRVPKASLVIYFHYRELKYIGDSVNTTMVIGCIHTYRSGTIAQTLNNNVPVLYRQYKKPARIAIVRPRCTVTSEGIITSPDNSILTAESPNNKLAPSIVTCPICQTTDFDVFQSTNNKQPWQCDVCNRDFKVTDDFVDLTVTSGFRAKTYSERPWAGTQIFRSPFVSFAYERGWRQSFGNRGFPGPNAEFQRAMEYFKDVKGGTLIDLSCGSGLFTRRFLRSQEFDQVIAVDFSETMLRETKAGILRERGNSQNVNEQVALIRADVNRLPFKSSSIPAVYAGAAIHCWPSPQQAFAEISRILQPGGVFVASTFLFYFAPIGEIFGDEVLAPWKMLDDQINAGSRAYNWFLETDLRDLADSVGLQQFQRYRSNRFILFSVTKPQYK
eukprot:TRINITY_DN7790_c0_g1_i4.p2 TRINITY_DN7790_c0_g1~~TRINITY_DN7790_c0_g1_i4.p2  ORF type:complete len:393 (-),score=12.85 TRINITY_DN7790_c0_g1_i4:236-1414(-)